MIDFECEDATERDLVRPLGWLRWSVVGDRRLPTHVNVWWLDCEGAVHRSIVEVTMLEGNWHHARLLDLGVRGDDDTERRICAEVIAELVCAEVGCERWRRGSRAEDPFEQVIREAEGR